MKNTALSFGGNQGDVSATFRWAREELINCGFTDTRSSSIYVTTPVGCAPGTPDFQNAAFTGDWPGSLAELHELCKNLEEKAGRPADHPRFASRTLDIDILFFGELVIKTKELTIPHPEASNRLFVLIPLEEIAGEWIFPGSQSTVSSIVSPMKKSRNYKYIIENKHCF